jgi:hypothetical protein
MGVKEYDIMGEWVELVDGKRFYPIPKEECAILCSKTPSNSAYIGTERWGMSFVREANEWNMTFTATDTDSYPSSIAAARVGTSRLVGAVVTAAAVLVAL